MLLYKKYENDQNIIYVDRFDACRGDRDRRTDVAA